MVHLAGQHAALRSVLTLISVVALSTAAHAQIAIQQPQSQVGFQGGASIDPEQNAVTLDGGARITYDHVIVSPGIQLDWDRIPGLAAVTTVALWGSLGVGVYTVWRILRSNKA